MANRTLDGLEVRSLGAARVRHDVERDLLAFVQAAQARCFDGGGVHEYVLAAAFRRDEAKALGGVEKFHGSDRHGSFLQRFPRGEMQRGTGPYDCRREGSSTV